MTVPQEEQITAAQWRKSSYSGSGNNCVEVAQVAGGCAVRDSKDPHGARLTFSACAWTAFVSSVKHGKYQL
jgi:Domain of unknown function (DUF397)